MTKELFKIQGVGLDTTTINNVPERLIENLDLLGGCYIHTNPDSNNDYLIDKLVKSLPDSPLVVSINSINDQTDYIIESHLKTIGRDKIDLLLLDHNSCKGDISVLAGLPIDNIGVKDLETLEEIEEIKKNIDFKYISLDICPLNFNWPIIKWCQDNKIDIIGFNPFGGRLSSQSVIDAFSIPYLLGFSSNYSSIVMLSGRDINFYLSDEISYLTSLIGKETSPKYFIRKSVKKLYKPVKKIIGTSIVVDKNTIIPYNSPEMIYFGEDLDLTLGSASTLKLPEEAVDYVERDIRNYVDSLDIPENLTKDNEILSLIRYRLYEYLKTKIKGKINLCRVGESEIIIQVIKETTRTEKKWFIKREVQDSEISNFLLTVYQGKPIIVLSSDQKG